MSTCQSILRSWPCLNIETVFPGMGIPMLKNKMVGRTSYLQHGDPYTSKMTSLYWDRPWMFYLVSQN